MQYIVALILIGIHMNTLADELPDPFKIGNCICIKSSEEFVHRDRGESVYRVKEIKGKWVHLERAEPIGKVSNYDYGWWNTDMIVQVTNALEPTE